MSDDPMIEALQAQVAVSAGEVGRLKQRIAELEAGLRDQTKRTASRDALIQTLYRNTSRMIWRIDELEGGLKTMLAQDEAGLEIDAGIARDLFSPHDGLCDAAAKAILNE